MRARWPRPEELGVALAIFAAVVYVVSILYLAERM